MQGINPTILIWAREQAGFSIPIIAKYFKKESQFIENWEKGLSSPSFPQLEKLALKYKRPTAIFFFPCVPKEKSIEQSFRTLPEQAISNIKPHLRYLVRYAAAMQINLFELNNGVNPAEKFLLSTINVAEKSINEVAEELRGLLGVNLDQQKLYKKPETAFKAWRALLEKYGIFVFKDAFKDDLFSGFCIHDDIFPVIYINNSQPDARQVFTLFHELAHLLFGVNGIEMSANKQDYPNELSAKDKKIEAFCNAFAGEFLVPDAAFKQHLNTRVDDNNLNNIAQQFVVSREVILRKFLDNNKITADVYRQTVEQWKNKYKATKNNKSGGNFHYTKRAYLGENYMEMAFGQYYKNNISVEQLAGYLGVNVKHIPKMESLIFEGSGACDLYF